MEGTCNGTNGFILAVTRVLKTERGIIREGVGSAVFTVKYQCITFMPNKDEVMDVVVKSVNKMGFFAESGPLQVFVSNHLIPEDFEFDTSHDPAYVTGDGEQKIVPNCEVRLRIVGTRVDNAEIVSFLIVWDGMEKRMERKDFYFFVHPPLSTTDNLPILFSSPFLAVCCWYN